MVVFRGGNVSLTRVRAREARVQVGGERCRVAAGTPLALLIRSRPGRLRLRDDFGSCPASGAGVYVVGIGPDQEGRLGAGGWVYKVGRKVAPAGAGDPAGPFGRGRLRRGQRVLWFYCRRANDCQRTLAVSTSVAGGELTARVTGYDDYGRGLRIVAATVRVGGRTLTTDTAGVARTTLPPGRYRVVAEKDGMVRSFPEPVTVG